MASSQDRNAPGGLTPEEAERLAGEFRPSWELDDAPFTGAGTTLPQSGDPGPGAQRPTGAVLVAMDPRSLEPSHSSPPATKAAVRLEAGRAATPHATKDATDETPPPGLRPLGQRRVFLYAGIGLGVVFVLGVGAWALTPAQSPPPGTKAAATSAPTPAILPTSPPTSPPTETATQAVAVASSPAPTQAPAAAGAPSGEASDSKAVRPETPAAAAPIRPAAAPMVHPAPPVHASPAPRQAPVVQAAAAAPQAPSKPTIVREVPF